MKVFLGYGGCARERSEMTLQRGEVKAKQGAKFRLRPLLFEGLLRHVAQVYKLRA